MPPSKNYKKVGQKLAMPDGQKLAMHEPYWRVPKSVGECHELTFASRCVYGVLASKVKSGTVAVVGQNFIAKVLGCSRTTVKVSLKQLQDLGKITAAERSPRSKGAYELHSDVFGQKQRDRVTSYAVDEESGHRSLASGGTDPKTFSSPSLISRPKKHRAA